MGGVLLIHRLLTGGVGVRKMDCRASLAMTGWWRVRSESFLLLFFKKAGLRRLIFCTVGCV